MLSAHHRFVVNSVCVTAVAAVSVASRPSEPVNMREVTRLRSHFAAVLSELKIRDVSALSASQRAARNVLIGRLEQYAATGRFPHNHVAPGRFVPVFRDEHGTLCAMGYLIASTGRTDIVDDVARNNNLARIPQLAGDERLRAWLDSTGLTVAEGARIQPEYDGRCFCITDPPEPTSHASAEYFVASGVALGVNALLTVRNLAPRDMTARQLRRNAVFGLVTGSGQAVLGAFMLDRRGADLASGVANMAVGTTAILSSVWRLRHLPAASVAARSVSVLPFVDWNRRAGLVVSARM